MVGKASAGNRPIYLLSHQEGKTVSKRQKEKESKIDRRREFIPSYNTQRITALQKISKGFIKVRKGLRTRH